MGKKEIEVIFTETVRGHFEVGERRYVKYGYARNYLFPKGLAVVDTPFYRNKLEQLQRLSKKESSHRHAEAIDLKEILDNESITLKRKVHDEGNLYGSVTLADIAESLSKTYALKIDKYDLRFHDNVAIIKELGRYKVAVTRHVDVPILVNIIVQAEESEKPASSNKKKHQQGETSKDQDKKEETKQESEATEDVSSNDSSEVSLAPTESTQENI